MWLNVAAVVILVSAPPEDLRCLPQESKSASASSPLYEQLQRDAYAALDRRQREVQQLKSADEIRAYQTKLREFFVQQLGGFPERSPLNAASLGVIPANGYRIEKVIFESQPHHHVTANLYLPDSPPPYPGVLVSSGHSRTAKTAEYNQRFGIMLARHGLAALCYDPIGQGERSQILTEDGKPQHNSTTQEHFLVGLGSILVGTNTARYRVWDAIRAVDYLTSRKDIDPQRIGMTGCSGGGTLTSYVMALDDRIACAAPACYLTTFRRLIETIGPQDAEQNIFGQVAYGLDQPDYVLLRAPRPTLISSTTEDFFDIQGSWENLRQAKRIYGRLGFPERVDIVEADGKHGVQPINLAAIAQWMRRWLLDKDGPVEVPELVTLPESELLCTERGQVLRLPGERSVFDLNAEIEHELTEKRKAYWQQTPRDEALQKVRQLTGVRPLADIPTAKWEKAGKVKREDYHIDKLVLRTDTGVPLPALTFHPAEPQEEAYLYVHAQGKLADAAVDGAIEKRVDEGYVVVAVDLRGQGETGGAAAKPDDLLGDWKTYYLAYLLGKSVVGMHTEDILTAGRFVAYYQTEKPRRVHLVGVGQAGVAALHAAALEPQLFTTVTLDQAPRDWSSWVSVARPTGHLTSTVHGALHTYDLPDLVRTLGQERVIVR